MLDLRTGESSFLTELDGYCHGGPGLAGDWLTWERNGARKVVMLRNLATNEERELTAEGEFYLYPETDGRYVVYSRGEGFRSDLFAHEIATGKVTTVVEANNSRSEAYLFDGKVRWTDLRDSQPGTYGYTSAYYEKVLPDGEEQLLRPAITPLMYARRVGEGLVWIDERTPRPTLWGKPKL
jgi:hypothetical protein